MNRRGSRYKAEETNQYDARAENGHCTSLGVRCVFVRASSMI